MTTVKGGNKNSPYISVVINCFDRRTYLKDAIDSVLNQDLDKNQYEIIALKKFKWKFENKLKDRVKFITSREKSACRRLYKGIVKSKGEIIVFLEDDDLFEKNKLSYIYNLFKNDRNLGYYHNNYNVIDEKNVIKTKILSETNKIDKLFSDNNSKSKNFLKMIKSGCAHNVSCQTIKKEMLKDYLDISSPFPDIRLFYLAYNSKFSMFADSKRFTRFRMWNQNLSRSFGDINKGLYLKNMAIAAYIDMERLLEKTKNNEIALKYINYNILQNTLILDMLRRANKSKIIDDILPYLSYFGPVYSNSTRMKITAIALTYLFYPKISNVLVNNMQ